MKKLIAISVMLVLLTGAVFAQASVGGNMKHGVQLIAGDFDGADPGSGRLLTYDVHTIVSFGDATTGGLMRLYSPSNEWQPSLFSFVWFRPIQLLRVQIGANPDGDWGAAQIGGWGFNGEAQGGTALDQHRFIGNATLNTLARVNGAFYPGFSALGIGLSLFPMDGLTVNIAVPFTDALAAGNLDNSYGASHVNFVYLLEDIGTIRVSTVLQGFDSIPDIYGSFFLTAIDGMAIDIGVSYVSEILRVGLGFRFAEGDFTFRLRAGAILEENNMRIGAHILPQFKVGDVNYFLNAGMGINLDTEALEWYVNPYLRAPMGNGISLYAGVQLWDDGAKIRWAVPLSFNVYF
jgi:hypothetical protein